MNCIDPSRHRTNAHGQSDQWTPMEFIGLLQSEKSCGRGSTSVSVPLCGIKDRDERPEQSRRGAVACAERGRSRTTPGARGSECAQKAPKERLTTLTPLQKRYELCP